MKKAHYYSSRMCAAFIKANDEHLRTSFDAAVRALPPKRWPVELPYGDWPALKWGDTARMKLLMQRATTRGEYDRRVRALDTILCSLLLSRAIDCPLDSLNVPTLRRNVGVPFSGVRVSRAVVQRDAVEVRLALGEKDDLYLFTFGVDEHMFVYVSSAIPHRIGGPVSEAGRTVVQGNAVAAVAHKLQLFQNMRCAACAEDEPLFNPLTTAGSELLKVSVNDVGLRDIVPVCPLRSHLRHGVGLREFFKRQPAEQLIALKAMTAAGASLGMLQGGA